MVQNHFPWLSLRFTHQSLPWVISSQPPHFSSCPVHSIILCTITFVIVHFTLYLQWNEMLSSRWLLFMTCSILRHVSLFLSCSLCSSPVCFSLLWFLHPASTTTLCHLYLSTQPQWWPITCLNHRTVSVRSLNELSIEREVLLLKGVFFFLSVCFMVLILV